MLARAAGVPVFLTAQQVADMLQVDERTVLRWAQHDASMPATRLGRVVRFERGPLLRWLARKSPRASRPQPLLVRGSTVAPTGGAPS
jgi:excisionase family DNA binding protein